MNMINKDLLKNKSLKRLINTNFSETKIEDEYMIDETL